MRTNAARNVRVDGVAKTVHPEQKFVEMMTDLLVKFRSPGDLVVDTCGRTFATAKACMLLREHRWFVSCDKDSKCSIQSIGSVVQVNARQLLNPQSDIEGSEKINKKCHGVFARTFCDSVKGS